MTIEFLVFWWLVASLITWILLIGFSYLATGRLTLAELVGYALVSLVPPMNLVMLLPIIETIFKWMNSIVLIGGQKK